MPVIGEEKTSTWAQYTIRVKKRDAIQEYLASKGIPTSVHYPVRLQECFLYFGLEVGDCPVAENAAREVLSLPMNPYLIEQEINYIADTVLSAV
jgi:UDP-2-acetamido-2-deoxy-ribo-hexuluronate aminotransferase